METDPAACQEDGFASCSEFERFQRRESCATVQKTFDSQKDKK